MVTPIKPSEVIDQKQKSFPDEVITSFNEMIIKNFSEGRATFKQKAVVTLMVEKGLSEDGIYENHWLDGRV